MERKAFWFLFTVLSVAADFLLPMWWAIGSAIPICILCWWLVYCNDWF